MSRSYSKARYNQAISEGWYDEVLIGRGKNARFVPAGEGEEHAKAKREAARSRVGKYGAAPNWFVSKRFNRPLRYDSKRIIKDILRGVIDEDEGIFPLHKRGAWYIWY